MLILLALALLWYTCAYGQDTSHLDQNDLPEKLQVALKGFLAKGGGTFSSTPAGKRIDTDGAGSSKYPFDLSLPLSFAFERSQAGRKPAGG